jgi:SAM-dependent methyltransferase
MADRTRQRALSFGDHAELYDRTRPSYPPELIADLLAPDPRDIVDVGCGTAKAARLLIGEGRLVVGIEPDERMAVIAASHGVAVEVTDFERWDPAGRHFDLLTAAQSWHWVDPVTGAAKAAQVLRPGGRFAAFWNAMHHTPDVQAVFAEVYRRHVPALLATSVALAAGATVDSRTDVAAAALAAGPFRQVRAGERTVYEWQGEYTAQEWVGLLRTHSDHAILEPELREALLADIEANLTRLGPTFPVRFTTSLLSAIRA